MSGPRVVYLERRDAGARLTRIRVVGLSGEHTWTADERLPFADVVSGAGAWLADTLPDKKIDVLCVDTAGGVAAWLDAPEGQPENARAIIEQSINGGSLAGADDDDDGTGGGGGRGGRGGQDDEIARFPGLPGESGIEAMPALDTDSDRLGVIVQPDPVVRLLLDDLDRRRISVGRVCSLWHLLAWAWKPTDRNGSWNARAGTTDANGESGSTDRVVSESHPATAMVLGDPAGRVVWAWSIDGKLVASGGHRLAGQRDHATIRAGDIPRLVHDWMSWSSQTGIAPDRIRIVGDFSNGVADGISNGASSGTSAAVPALEDAPNAGTDLAPTDLASTDADAARPIATPSATTESDIASALGRRWPDAALDMVNLDDPIGETLLRAARHADQRSVPELSSTTGLSSLSQRRGRVHRAMYRWGGLAMVGLAIVLLVAAWGVRQDGAAAQRQASQFVNARQNVLDALNAEGGFTPLLNLREFPDQAIQNAIGAMNQRAPAETVRPILRELETMAFVVGNPDIAIHELAFNGAGIVQLALSTPDTQTAEILFDSLRTIDGSYVRWTNRQFVRDQQINGETWGRWTFTGTWIDADDIVTPSTPSSPNEDTTGVAPSGEGDA